MAGGDKVMVTVTRNIVSSAVTLRAFAGLRAGGNIPGGSFLSGNMRGDLTRSKGDTSGSERKRKKKKKKKKKTPRRSCLDRASSGRKPAAPTPPYRCLAFNLLPLGE